LIDIDLSKRYRRIRLDRPDIRMVRQALMSTSVPDVKLIIRDLDPDPQIGN